MVYFNVIFIPYTIHGLIHDMQSWFNP